MIGKILGFWLVNWHVIWSCINRSESFINLLVFVCMYVCSFLLPVQRSRRQSWDKFVINCFGVWYNLYLAIRRLYHPRLRLGWYSHLIARYKLYHTPKQLITNNTQHLRYDTFHSISVFGIISRTFTSVVPINQLIGDLTIFTSNFDDQSQFLKTNHFSDYLHMLKRHTFCFFYVFLINRYTFCVSICISTLFLQVLSWIFMKNVQHMMHNADGEGSMCTKNIFK